MINLGENWGVKDGGLLAYKQTRDKWFDKSFDYVGGANGTRVDRDGLIKPANVYGEDIISNVPRIDFLNNPDGHLLLEPQRTNLIRYSEDFSSWLSNGTKTPNYGISPSGENNRT